MKTKYLIIIGILLIISITIYLFWDDIKSWFAPKDANRDPDSDTSGGSYTPPTNTGSNSSNTSPLAPNPIVQYSGLKVGDVLIATKTRLAYSAPPATPGVKKYAGMFNPGSYIGVITQVGGGVLKVKNWTSGPFQNQWGVGSRITDFYLSPGEYQVKK